MSDVTVAPPSAAPSSSPAPAQSEVQINQNPASSPNPVGPQAPPAPVTDHKGSEHRPQSRRESLQAAFDRANNPPPKTTRPERAPPKAAEAKPGHNQPPEETPKLDLKKRPDDQPQAEPQPRDRGRFAPRQPQDGEQNRAMQGNAGADGQTYKRLPSHAPFAEPPQRISESAKRDWADTPETVRGDIHRMHHEFGRAYQAYKGAADAFQPVARFHQMAQEHGTTLEKALHNYVSIENKLRQDPIAGLDTIVYNLGLTDPETGQRLGLRDVAYSVLSQSPEQLRQIQQGNVQQAATQQIGALHQEISGLKTYLHQMHNQQQYSQQYSYTRSAVDQFAETHPRIDEEVFGEIVKNEIGLGFDLDTAYRRAELLLPATRAAQTRTTPAQTRHTADRSIYGNPDVAPSDGASRRAKDASPTARDAVKNAMQRYNGAH